MEDLVFRRMQPTDADLGLFKRSFDANGSPRSVDHLRWQFLDPPAGEAKVVLALTAGEEPEVAAIYATFPVVMKIGLTHDDCGQSLDTLTDARYRGRGLFTRVAAMAYDHCREGNYGLVYGFPNANSAPGFFNRLGWISLDPVPLLVRPLRSGYLLKRLGLGNRFPTGILDLPIPLPPRRRLRAGWELRQIEAIEPVFDPIWARFAHNIKCAVDRDSRYLRWRLSKPERQYEVVGLYSASTLEGYVVTSVVANEQGTVGKLMELVFDPDDQKAGRLLLGDALHRLRHQACDAVWGMNLAHAPNHKVLRQAGFVSPPSRFIAGQHFGVLPLAAAQENVSRREHWYISLLDSDAD